MFFIKSKNKYYAFSEEDSKVIVNYSQEVTSEVPTLISDVVVGSIPIASGVSTGKKTYRILRREGVKPVYSGLAGIGTGLLNSGGIATLYSPAINAGLGALEKEQINDIKSNKKSKKK